MDAFKTNLKAFVSNELSYDQLEDELYACLERNPDNAHPVYVALTNLCEQGIITDEVYEDLQECINTFKRLGGRPGTKPPQKSFQDLIKEFVSGQVEYDELEQGLIADIQQNLDKLSRYVTALDALERQKLMEPEVIASLRGTLETFNAAGEVDQQVAAGGGAPSAPIVEESGGATDGDDDEDEDKTRIFSGRNKPESQSAPATSDDGDDDEDKTRIFSGRNTPEPAPAAGAGEGENEDEEKTQFFGSRKQAPQQEPEQEPQPDRTSGTNTSRTASTTRGSTTSLWNKPFDAEEEQPLAVGSVLMNRFRLTEFIGYGGMGDVYKAIDQIKEETKDPEPEVAVKVLNKEFRNHPESLRSLQREASKTQSLAHPHIVNVFDFNRDEHHVFMTMALMRGQELGDIIKKTPDGLPLDVAKRYIREMSDALAFAHRRGVIHSDFKPGNIFVDNGEIKIIDFGIAREAKSKDDETGEEKPRDEFDAGDLGALTPSYASLEMLEDGSDPDPRDDIYALGCVAYEIITGRHPFKQGKKKISAEKAKAAGMKPEKIASLKSWQWEALRKLLEFDRADRTAEVTEFIAEFSQETKAVSQKIIFGGAAAAASVIGIALFLPGYLTQREVDNFKGLVETGEAHDVILSRIDEISTLEGNEQDLFFEENDMDLLLIGYLSERVNALIGNDDFELATPVLGRAEDLYGRLTEYRDLADSFNERRKERLNELDTAFNELLRSATFAVDYPKIRELFDTFTRVDKSYPQDATVQNAIFELSDLARGLVSDEDYVQANDVIAFSLDVFSEDQRVATAYRDLESLKTSIANRIDRQAREQEIAQLVLKLESVTSSAPLDAYRQLVPDVSSLALLEPTNPSLISFQRSLRTRLDGELQNFMADREWSDALVVLDQFSSALPPGDLAELKDLVATSQTGFNDQLNDITRSINRVSRGSNPGDAMPLLAQLGELNVEASVIRDAENQIAEGWLRQSRIKASQLDFQTALAFIDQGLKVTNDMDVRANLQAEISRMDEASQQANSQLAQEQAQRLEQERLARVKTLEGEVAALVQSSGLTGSDARNLLDTFDQLEIEDANNAVLIDAKRSLVQRYVSESYQIAESGEVADAITMIKTGLDILPEANALTIQLRTFEDQLAEQQQAQQQQQIATLETRLNSQIQNFGETRAMDDLLVTLQEYEALQGGRNVFSNDIRFQAADVFVNRAESLKNDNLFDDADQAIVNARRIDDTHGRIAGLQRSVRDARDTYQSSQAEARRIAQIEGLKQSYVAQIRAYDIDKANTTLDELRTQGLSGQDPFFGEVVPQEAEAAYLALIGRTSLPAELDQAFELVEEGLELSPSSSSLQSKKAALEEAERIIATLQVNVPQGQQLLAQAIQTYPSEAFFSNIQVPTSNTATAPSAAVTTTTAVAVNGKACEAGMIGRGRLRDAFCFDQIGDIKGPRLVVVDGPSGPLAVMKYELRVGDYNSYCAATGCPQLSDDSNLPATGLSMTQVQAYLDWLNAGSGSEYRIPTLNEWQVAANAGGVEQPDKNCVTAGRGVAVQKINAWKANGLNGWGLAHSVGNAQELTLDGGSYVAAGGAYTDNRGDCSPSLAKAVDGPDEVTGFRFVRRM